MKSILFITLFVSSSAFAFLNNVPSSSDMNGLFENATKAVKDDASLTYGSEEPIEVKYDYGSRNFKVSVGDDICYVADTVVAKGKWFISKKSCN